MTHLNVYATPGIVTTRIESWVDEWAGCPCGGVVWISIWPRGTECWLRNGYHSCSPLIIPGKLFSAIFTHSSRVFPYKIDSGNPITTFSVSNLDMIAAATGMTVMPRPISSATSAPGISESETHLLTMNDVAQTWCTTNLVPGRPPIEYLWPGTQSTVDWQIRWALGSLTASSRHRCSNSLLIVSSTVFNTELLLSGLRTSSPSCTCSSTSLAPLSVFFSSSMFSFGCFDVSWADGLIFRRSWNPSQC